MKEIGALGVMGFGFGCVLGSFVLSERRRVFSLERNQLRRIRKFLVDSNIPNAATNARKFLHLKRTTALTDDEILIKLNSDFARDIRS